MTVSSVMGDMNRKHLYRSTSFTELSQPVSGEQQRCGTTARAHPLVTVCTGTVPTGPLEAPSTGIPYHPAISLLH